MDHPRITVVGEAARWAPADHADVTFTVTRRARESADAVRSAGEVYAAVDAVLAEHAAAVVRRTTRALNVREVVRWDEGRRVHEGFEASRSVTARFAPVAGGSAALRAVIERVPDLFVTGPWFGLDPANPVHQAVRADAATAARASAEAYAAGLGLTLGSVLSMREPGLRPDDDDDGIGVQRMALGMAKEGAGDESVLVELTEEDVEVTAEVEVVFGLSQ